MQTTARQKALAGSRGPEFAADLAMRLGIEAEIDAAERATAHPIESACVVYYGTVMFGEVLIHPEP